MNEPLARFPGTANKKSAAVVRPAGRGTGFYLMAGIAGGLGAVSIACGLLLVRSEAKSAAPQQVAAPAPAPLIEPTVVPRPIAPPPVVEEETPQIPDRIAANQVRPARAVDGAVRVKGVARAFKGTIAAGEKEESAEPAEAAAAEPAVEADDKAESKDAAVEAAASEQAESATEVRRGGKFKKVVGSLFRPFGRKKNAEQ